MPGLISPGFACLSARRWGFGSDDLVISAGFLLLGLKFRYKRVSLDRNTGQVRGTNFWSGPGIPDNVRLILMFQRFL